MCCVIILQVFNNGSVPSSVQATFPYIFSVSKFLQVFLTFSRADASNVCMRNIQKPFIFITPDHFLLLCSLDRLILWAPLYTRQTNIHTKTLSIMALLKLSSLVFYSVWNLFSFLLLELHFLSYLGYGLMVKYRTSLR